MERKIKPRHRFAEILDTLMDPLKNDKVCIHFKKCRLNKIYKASRA